MLSLIEQKLLNIQINEAICQTLSEKFKMSLKQLPRFESLTQNQKQIFDIVVNTLLRNRIEILISSFKDSEMINGNYNEVFNTLIKNVIDSLFSSKVLEEVLSDFISDFTIDESLENTIFLPILSKEGKTLPSDLINQNTGFPKNLYTFNKSNAFQALYSAYIYYQQTFTPLYLTDNYAGCSGNGCCNCGTGENVSTCDATNCLCPPSESPNGPSNIFILRHGEKSSGQWNINENGIYRAAKLVDWVNELGKKGFPISYIVTCNPCSLIEVEPSMRPQQTISMVSTMLNIPMFIYGGSQDTEIAVKAIYSNCFFKNTNVLICWEHGNIQGLLQSIVQQKIDYNQISIPYKDYWVQQTINSENNNPCQDGNYINKDFLESNPLLANENTFTPYWNNYTYNFVIHFDANSDINLYQQPIFTAYSSCMLNICMFQKGTNCVPSNLYSNEDDSDAENNCSLPDESWQV